MTRGFYEYVDIGSSYIQSNLLGALGITQLEKIDRINKERQKIANYFIQELMDIPGLEFLKITPGSKSNYHIFGILVPPDEKYWIMDALRAEGIMANVHYTTLHKNKFYSHLTTDNDMPGAMQFFNPLLRFPIYPSLTEKEKELIVEAVRKILI